MKKHLLFSLITLFAVSKGQAQISLGQYDFPFGIVQYFAYDSTGGGISLGSGGANQSWDFSTLQDQGRDTAEYTNPDWTPYGSSFPGSNLAISQGSETTIYATSSSSGMEILGYVLNFEGEYFEVPFDNSQTFIQFPLTYQTSFSDVSAIDFTAAASIAPGVDSVRLKNHTSFTNLVDGYGTLTTPTGTYDVLRMYVTEISTDSVWGYVGLTSSWQLVDGETDTTYRYEFFADDLAAVSTVYVDGFGNPYSASYYLSHTTGVEDPTSVENHISVYPNPANEKLYFNGEFDGSSSMDIFDITGKQVASHTLPQGTTNIDVSNLSKGLYIYQIVSADNDIIGKGKLQIAR